MPDPMDEETKELWGHLVDPATSPGQAAAELFDMFCDPDDLTLVSGEPVPMTLGRDLARDHGLMRAGAVVEALLDRTPEHPAALTFAAGVAAWEGAGRRVVELLAHAAWNSHDPGVHRSHALALLATGDLRALLPLLEGFSEEDLFEREDIRRAALRRAAARASYPPGRPCPCDSGLPHASCCRPIEEAALEKGGVC